MTNAGISVGFIGLGSQGGPMARRIVEAGYPLTLWARRADTLSPYADTAAKIAETIADVGAICDHVAICVVDDAGVRQVCGELIPVMAAGSRIVIHSTVHPQTCMQLEEEAGRHGIELIDAPVSGGGGGAAAGTLTVMVGGEDATVAGARPVFETFAGTIIHLGPVGAGQSAKLANNALMAANMGLAWQALEAASALGIDRAAFAELVKVSSGRSFGFEVAARLSVPTDFTHGAALLAKDVRLLGETLGDHSAAVAFDAASRPFLDRALPTSARG